MDNRIDPMFSVYRYVKDNHDASMIITHRQAMLMFSHQVEAMSATNENQWRLFVGFQRWSNFLRQQTRYEALAVHADHIVIFGIPDVEPPDIPKVSFIALKEEDKLVDEWFLVAYGDQYKSVLVCEDYWDEEENVQIFHGLWSFEQTVVDDLQYHLSSQLAMEAMPESQSDYSQQIQRMQETLESILSSGTNSSQSNDTPLDSPKASEAVKKDVTILFGSIKNFLTARKDKSSGEALSTIVTPYFDTFSRAVREHGGFVDKVISSDIVAVFDTPSQALEAAKQAMKGLALSHPELDICMAVAHGPVFMFNAPGEDIPTVFGKTVDEARRLTQEHELGIWLLPEAIHNLDGNQGSLARKVTPGGVYQVRM